MERLERVKGALFGVACGDALGATLEFLTQEEGMASHGYLRDIVGGGWLHLHPGEITDDTKMTIAVAKGILEEPQNPINAIGRYFVEWYTEKPNDVGIACETAIKKYIRCQDWEKASHYTHKILDEKTAGNGTLMRCIPIALYYEDYEKMVEVTKKQSKMTHYDEIAAEACVLYDTLIFKYLAGGEKESVIKETIRDYWEYEDIFTVKKKDLNPSGYVVDSMRCALWSFIQHDTAEEIICEAVNLCGDADTIGAIAGGLAGVYYGYKELPKRWKDKLTVKSELKEIAERICGAAAWK